MHQVEILHTKSTSVVTLEHVIAPTYAFMTAVRNGTREKERTRRVRTKVEEDEESSQLVVTTKPVRPARRSLVDQSSTVLLCLLGTHRTEVTTFMSAVMNNYGFMCVAVLCREQLARTWHLCDSTCLGCSSLNGLARSSKGAGGCGALCKA
eukprot:4045052-Amphidinium_carterae.1